MLLPVQQIRAGGVQPVHRSPKRPIGVVLGEHVPGAVFIKQAVGVVDPAALRGEVILWPKIAIAFGAHWFFYILSVRGYNDAFSRPIHSLPLPRRVAFV